MKKTIKKLLSVIAAAFLGVLCLVRTALLPAAADSAKVYTDVLTDLKKDTAFNEAEYRNIEDHYGFEVIQIAESADGELFIYVYQPSDKTKDLTATEIRMSTPEVDKDVTYTDYALTLVSESGVFDKYVVSDFTVKSDSVRYYNIVHIARPYDKEIDEWLEYENTESTVPYGISQKWRAITFTDGTVSYALEKLETITITDKVVGFIRYDDGFKFFPTDCDSHFVAFSTDRKIDELLEVDLTYVSQSCTIAWFPLFGAEEEFGKEKTIPLSLTAEDEGGNAGDGWFGKKYTWERIEPVSDFLKEAKDNEDMTLTKVGKTSIETQQWILRFTETEHKIVSYANGGYSEYSTKVSDVTILRLKFKTEGEVYNLGVVDNKQTGSDNPSGTVSSTNNDEDILKNILSLILLVLVALIFIPFIGPILMLLFKVVGVVLGWLFKGLLWAIKLPFKILGKLFKRKKK